MSYHRAPLSAVAAAFAVGIGLAWWLNLKLTLLWSLSALAAGSFLWVRHRPGWANLCLVILVVGLGAFRACLDSRIPADSVAHFLEATLKPITCEGVVLSDVRWVRPANGPVHRQGWFRITHLKTQEGRIPLKGQVLLKLTAHSVGLAYGDRVRVSGSIRGPRPVLGRQDAEGKPAFNEKQWKPGFNEKQWLWAHGAFGVLTVADSESIQRVDSESSLWIRYRRWVASFRGKLKALGESLLTPLEAAYLDAFLLGRGEGIPKEVWDAFKRVGVIHVLVVSGLHVGLIGVIGLIGLSLVRVPRGWRYLTLSVGLVTYCVLTGGDSPIVRATIMGVLLCLGKAAGQEVSSFNSLGLAGLLILAVHPRALADAGFQLSFGAVVGLFTLTPWISRRFSLSLKGEEAEGALLGAGLKPGALPVGLTLWRWMAQGMAASCGAWLAVAPVVAWHFKLFTPVALVANLVVIPWSCLAIATGFVLYVTGLIHPGWGGPFAAVFHWMVEGLNRLVTWLADLPLGSFTW